MIREEESAGVDGTIDGTIVQDDQARERSRERSLGSPAPEVSGYRVERRLGAGSYGEVWLATDLNTQRKVAIKFFSQSQGLDWPLLKREVGKLLEMVTERRVVQLLRVGWDAEPPYYVMEYLPGGSLADRMAGRPLAPRDAVAVVREVAAALVYLHGKAILHCDLKPGNVLLDERGETRLADFGQARLSSDQGPAIGTLFYMAPEQAEAGARPDVRADIYSLGALAYTMLTGKAPYTDAEGTEKIASTKSTSERIQRYRKLIDQSPPPSAHRQVPGVDGSLADIVDRCLERNPAGRFENVPQLVEALEARERQRARRPLVVLGLVGPLALLLALGGVGVWARRQAVSEATQAILGDTLQDATSYATLVSTVVDRNLSAARRQVEREAESAEVAQLIAAAGRGDRLAVVRLQERTDALYETYKDRSLHNWVIADANATVLTRAPIDPSVIGQRYTYREWFSGRPDVPAAEAPAVAAPRQQASITRAFRSTAAGRALVVSVASPIWITERDTRRVVGVVSATIHLDTFNQWLVEAEGEKDASGCPARFAVLLNQSQLVRHPCPTAGSPPLPVEPDGYSEREAVQHLWTSANGRSAAFADPLRSDRSYLAAGAALRENPTWRAIVEFDRDHSLAQVNLLDRQFGVIGMVTAGLGLAAVVGLWLMLYRLTRETATARLHQRAPVKGA